MEGGPVPARGEILDAPLPLSAGHGAPGPPVTFGQYFAAVTRMLSGPGEALLRRAAGAALSLPGPLAGPIPGVEIRSERHGAFYHPARIRVETEGGAALLAANVAVSDPGLALVRTEAEVLSSLSGQARDFLPAVYGVAETPLPPSFRRRPESSPSPSFPRTPESSPSSSFRRRPESSPPPDRMARMLLTQWFEGFFEFHLNRRGGLSVWDDDAGHRELPEDRAGAVYEAAGRIVALCYDPDTAVGLAGWNQAAGDFVVRPGDAGVRLVTARARAALSRAGDVVTDAFWFLLNASLRLRLDRVEGTGPFALAGGDRLAPILRGLLSGLSGRAAETGRHPGLARDLMGLLSGLGADHLAGACALLAESSNPRLSETPVLLAGAESHGRSLFERMKDEG